MKTVVDFLAAHWFFLAFVAVVIGSAAIMAAPPIAYEREGETVPGPSQRATWIGAAVVALMTVALLAASYMELHQQEDAWAETAEVVTEKAVEKYGDVFVDDQFHIENVRYNYLSAAQTWSIDDEPRLCAAEVIADRNDPGNADVTVVCGGTELPRVD